MQSSYYLTISECPLTAWEKSYKDGYSAIRKPDSEFNFTDQTDYDAWDLLFIDWQENIKQDSDFEDYQQNKRTLNLLMIKFIKSEVAKGGVKVSDRSIRNEMRRVEALLFNYEKTLGKGKTINQNLQALSKAQGYQIKKHDLTVQDYFDLIELHSEKPVTDG